MSINGKEQKVDRRDQWATRAMVRENLAFQNRRNPKLHFTFNADKLG